MAQNIGGQEGTGSAENTGRDRSEQLNTTRELSQDQKNAISSEAGENTPIADIRDLGQLSGSDALAGGSDNVMDDQQQAEDTDR
jgi:hypothetical protein